MIVEKVLVNGGYPLHTFEDVEEIYKTYISSPEDRAMIRKAYDFIMQKHEGQQQAQTNAVQQQPPSIQACKSSRLSNYAFQLSSSNPRFYTESNS